MSSYSSIERNIARLLSRFPVVKKVAKSGYSRLMYLKARKPFRYYSLVEPLPYGVEEYSSYFGYYDKSPVNSKGQVLVQISSHTTKALPSIQDKVELIVLDDNHNTLLRLPIKTYNWQQGCRAHWLNDDLFIFNDFELTRNCYVSRVYSVSIQAQIKVFDYPVQDSFNTNYFISLNYQRLMTLRPDYGYRNLPNMSHNELSDLYSDGLWIVKYETGESTLLISLADACKIKPLPEFNHAVHKFNHVMISPDGQRFIFMHRYLLGKRRFDRLLLADATTGEVKLVSDYGMVSHCFWAGNDALIGYMRGPGDKDGYWLVDVTTGKFKPCLQEKLDEYGDGHPHVHGNWFVTDTYPDKSRMQHLLLCNWKTGEVEQLGEFFHGFEYAGETRCDLHPRFSPDGKTVFFDSVFSGKRQLYALELPK